MDITSMNDEQKVSAAVAYLSKNLDKAPESTHKSLAKLARLNNEGMECVSKIDELKKQMAALDAAIGEKIGGAKVIFEIVGEQLTKEQVEEFATAFEPSQLQMPDAPVKKIDMAGATAPKIAPTQEESK